MIKKSTIKSKKSTIKSKKSTIKQKNDLKYIELINLLKDIDEKNYKIIRKYISSNKEDKAFINKLDIFFASRHMAPKTAIEIKINEFYSKEINKIIYLIQNPEMIKKIGGIKILLHGPTGSGKTTIFKKITNMNKNIEFININLEEYVSSKMGQTQLNLLALANNLSNGIKKFVFMDELDSVITSRNDLNDIGEHSRIVATFIKFLDNLSNDVMLIVATNLVKKIDSAIFRRFSIKMETRNLTSKEFFNKYNEELKNTISTQSINKLIKIFASSHFSIADINYLKNHILIQKEFIINLNFVIETLILFQNKLKNIIIKDELSYKKYELYKKRIKNV